MSLNNDLKSSQNCENIQQLIPEYAFGLTSLEETKLVEANLAACPQAAADLADYRRLQEEMREEVPQIEPPVGLEAKLMAAIAVPAAPAERINIRPQSPAPHMPSAAPIATPVTPVAVPKPRRNIAWLAAAAAILALVITNIFWFTQVNELAERQRELEIAMHTPDDTAFVLTSTANLRWVRLPPSQQEADSNAFLMWDAASEIGLMYARAFPQLEPGMTYQLWLTRSDVRVSAGTFRIDEDGNGALLFHSAQPIDEFTWARITAEPEEGSEQPSENVVVIGEL